MKMKNQVILLASIIFGVSYCFGMEPIFSEEAVSTSFIQAIKVCYDALQTASSDDESHVALDEFKEYLSPQTPIDLRIKIEGYPFLVYLLHHFGAQEKLMVLVTEFLVPTPAKKEAFSDEKYEKAVKSHFKNVINLTTDNEHRTALHYAAGYGYFWLVQKLLYCGADCQCLDAQNASALHYAVGCDDSLMPYTLQKISHEQQKKVEVRHGDVSMHVGVPSALFTGLSSFASMSKQGPVHYHVPLSVQIINQYKPLVIQAMRRACIVKLLLDEKLAHSVSDASSRTPFWYAQNKADLLSMYILGHWHDGKYSNEEYFNYALRVWVTIFGCLEELQGIAQKIL